MRKSLLALVLTTGFVLACSGGEEPEETEATTDEATTEPPAEAPPANRRGAKAGSDAGPTTFTCCSAPSVQNLMSEYLDLQMVLYTQTDPESLPSAECYALEGAANQVKGDGRISPADQKVAAELASLLDRIKNNSMQQIRGDLPEITAKVEAIAKNYQGGETTVAAAECAGQGPWLQEGDVLKSPYGAVAGSGGRGKGGKRGGGTAALCAWK